MVADVKTCVDIRVNFFDQYYIVPADLQGEVNAFIREMTELGEKSADSSVFEKSFVSTGLSDRFNNLLVKCTPKAYNMNQQEKSESKKVFKKMLAEDKERIATDLLDDVADSAQMMAESELISRSRQQMVQEGVLDEYTRATNYVDFGKDVIGFFGKKFKKK